MLLKFLQMCIRQYTFSFMIYITSFIYLENIVLTQKVQNFKYSWKKQYKNASKEVIWNR